MTVERVDFGKDARESGRRLARLLDIAEEFEADLQQNPAKYYDRAVTEIVRLQLVLRSAKEALRAPPPTTGAAIGVRPLAPEVVSVPADQWRRMKAAAQIILDVE